MDDLLKGIAIKPWKQEELFEEIRFKDNPNLPSRLRCHFLSISKEVAEQRLKEWVGWKNKRILTRCYLILSSGKYHFANIDEYQEAVKEKNENLIKQYAGRYWGEGFSEAKYLDKRIELLADSSLYFPEWKKFSKMELPDKPKNDHVNWLKLESYTEGGWKKIY